MGLCLLRYSFAHGVQSRHVLCRAVESALADQGPVSVEHRRNLIRFAVPVNPTAIRRREVTVTLAFDGSVIQVTSGVSAQARALVGVACRQLELLGGEFVNPFPPNAQR